MKTQKLIPWHSTTIKAGDVYGRYTILSTHKKEGTYVYLAKVACKCGSPPRFVQTGGLRNGEIKSCGCLHKEKVTKHGCWGHPLFVVWSHMMARCYNQKDKRYSRYGGRGITVCKEWHSPAGFISDMSDGYKEHLQLDRINNDQNYYKENCRWATRKTQARNKSTNVLITFNGQTKCIGEWAEIYSIKYHLLRERILIQCWSPERALTTPVLKT